MISLEINCDRKGCSFSEFIDILPSNLKELDAYVLQMGWVIVQLPCKKKKYYCGDICQHLAAKENNESKNI